MTPTTTLNDFFTETKSAMTLKEQTHEKQTILKESMLRFLAQSSVEEIEQAFRKNGAAGDDIGDRVVHSDPDLSLVYGHIPPRYQSGIFDHAAYGCTMTLEGKQKITFYTDNQGALEEIKSTFVGPGEVLELVPETIRSVENPTDHETRFFQCYLGDIRELDEKRHLWDWKTHRKVPFSNDESIKQGVLRMSAQKNNEGLAKLVEILPTMKPIVEAAK